MSKKNGDFLVMSDDCYVQIVQLGDKEPNSSVFHL
jgi:hypothetical protein